MRQLILLILTAVLGGGAGRAANLRAAAGEVDITPPVGTPMWGYSARGGPATGTLDPLMARVLLLEAGNRRVAIVTLDLGRTFGERAIQKLRDEAKRSSNVDYIFVAASHTHAGPVILDEYPGDPPAWESQALGRIQQAIASAAARLTDAKLGSGFGIAYVGHNRLKLGPDDSVTWLDRNPNKVPTSPFDPTVAVLRVDSADGVPLAVLVNYACHPVVFGPDNRQFSADYVAAMVRTVQSALGPQVITLFVQGGAGDINPYYAVTALEQDAVQWRDWTGGELGKEAARVAKSIQTETSGDDSLDFAEDRISTHLRWDAGQFREGMAEVFGKDFESQFGPPIREQIDLPVATLLINKKIAFLGLPGEPFVDLQTNWRSRCPVHAAFFAGYANGYHGYFPTIERATSHGYGTSSVTTWVEPGAGERMVDHALVQIYTLMGKLTNIPYRARY